MRTLGSVAALLAAIREETETEIERLERDAEAALASLRAEALPTSDPESDPRVVAVRRRVVDGESQEEWSATLEDLEDRERWFEEVAALGRSRLAGASGRADVRIWTRALVGDAIRHLPAGACIVLVPPAAIPHLDRAWCEETGGATGREIAVESGPVTAGCIVRLADRSLSCDNSLDAREHRTRAQWRAALARLYATTASAAETPVDRMREAPV